jgi:hypothetical protein
MDVPKATHVAVLLDRADVGPLFSAVVLKLSEPLTSEVERTARLSLACQLRSALRVRP